MVLTCVNCSLLLTCVFFLLLVEVGEVCCALALESAFWQRLPPNPVPGGPHCDSNYSSPENKVRVSPPGALLCHPQFLTLSGILSEIKSYV